MNSKVRRLLAWLIVWGCGPASLLLAEELPLKYRKAFQLPSPAQAGVNFVAVELDEDVYAATKENFSDLRVLDSVGEPVPYLLHTAVAKEAKKKTFYWNAVNPDLKPLADAGLEITIHLRKDDDPPESVRFVTPLKNFEQRVQVFTSPMGEVWTAAGEEALIYDYSQYMDVRNTRIPMPETQARYYRFVIDKVTDEQESQLLELTKKLQGKVEASRTERTFIQRRPFRMDRLEFAREITTEQYSGPRLAHYPIDLTRTTEKPERKQTWLEITTRREPLTEFRIETEEKNFSRAARVQAEVLIGEQSGWRELGGSTLSRIDFKSLQQEALKLQFPETRATRYRIIIENRDSPPLTINAVSAFGKVVEVVFLAESMAADSSAPAEDQPAEQTRKPEYHLAYGGDLAAPNYDTASIQKVLNSTFSPESVTLGPEIEIALGDLPPEPFSWSKLFNNKPLLFSVMGLLVVALGWGLFQAAKRVEQLPPE